MSFEQQVKEAAERAVLKIIADGGWLLPNYENRLRMPVEWMTAAWASIDRDRLLACIKDRIEAELADRVVNHMAAELATDIKQILSVKERREALRALARDHMESIMAAGSKP